MIWLTTLAYGACTVITGSSVLQSSGFEQVDVRFDGAVITAIGHPKTEGCEVVDGSGQVLTPGLVGFSQVGLVEVWAAKSTNYTKAKGSESILSSHQAFVAYDPQSSVIPTLRREGLTHSVVYFGQGQVSGQAAFVRFTGATQAEAVVEQSVGFWVNLIGGPAQGFAELDELLDEVVAYSRGKSAPEGGYHHGASVSDIKALVPVIKGQVPLMVVANRASTIEALLRFVKQRGVKLVLVGGAEAYKHKERLAKEQISVVVDPYIYGVGGFTELGARSDNAAILSEAGVNVIFQHDAVHRLRDLRQLAGNAVRAGMKHHKAVTAITQGVGAAFGLPHSAVEVGANASVVLWSADPLELSSYPNHLWIDGSEQPLLSRQQALTDRYRVLPGSPLPPLSLPEKLEP